jgi:hypothetical protein
MPTATTKGKKCGNGHIANNYVCRKGQGASQQVALKAKSPVTAMATAVAAGAGLLGISAASYLALKARYRSGLKESALQVARDARKIDPRSLPDVSGKEQITFASPGFGGHGGKERGQEMERKFFKGMQTIMGDSHAVIGLPNEKFNLDPFEPDKWRVKDFDPATAYSKNKVVQAAFAKEAFKKMIGTTLEGKNQESLKLATQAYALHLKHPEKPINIVGYSAGGVIAKEAGEHLNLLGVEPKIITVGTPWFGILEPKNTYDITSNKDAVVAKFPKRNPIYFNDVKEHLGYLPNQKVQKTLRELTKTTQTPSAKKDSVVIEKTISWIINDSVVTTSAQTPLMTRLIKVVLESVYVEGIDGLPYVEIDGNGGFTGKFKASGEFYDYFITSDGRISYVESDSRNDTAYAIAYLKVQKRTDKIDKPKRCQKGKPCKNTCIAKGITCRTTISKKATPAFKAAQSLLNLPTFSLPDIDIKALQKAAPYIAASLGIAAAGGLAAYLATKQAKSFIDNQFGESIHPETESFYKNAKHPKRYINGIELKSSDPDDYKTVPDSSLFKEPPYPPGVEGANRKAGVTIIEPDGRVWMMESQGAYGGEFHGFPRGGAEPDLTDQQNAIKEAHEEVGLQVRIIDHLGDFDHYTGKPVEPGDKPAAVTRQYIGVRVGGNPADAHYESSKVKLATLGDAYWMTAFNSKRDQNAIVNAAKSYVRQPQKQQLLHQENSKLRIGKSRYDTIEDFQKVLARYDNRADALQGELGLSRSQAKEYEKSLHWWTWNQSQKIISGVETGAIKTEADVAKVMNQFKFDYSDLNSKEAGYFASNPKEAITNAKRASEHLADFMKKAPKISEDTPKYRGMSFSNKEVSDGFIESLNKGIQPKRLMSWTDNEAQTKVYMNAWYSGPNKVMMRLEKPKNSVIFSPWGDWNRWHPQSRAAGRIYKMKDFTAITKTNDLPKYLNAVASAPPYTELLNQKDTRYKLKSLENKGSYKVANIEEY